MRMFSFMEALRDLAEADLAQDRVLTPIEQVHDELDDLSERLEAVEDAVFGPLDAPKPFYVIYDKIKGGFFKDAYVPVKPEVGCQWGVGQAESEWRLWHKRHITFTHSHSAADKFSTRRSAEERLFLLGVYTGRMGNPNTELPQFEIMKVQEITQGVWNVLDMEE